MPDDETEESHVHEVGAFDPIEAWATTMHKLMQLVGAVREAPGALPAKEILRAAQISLDTLEVIQEFSIHSLMHQLSDVVDDEDWSDHSLTDDYTKENRTEEETARYKMGLLRKVATTVQIEDTDV